MGGDVVPPADNADGAPADDSDAFRRLWTLDVSLPEIVTSSSDLQSLLPLLLRRGQLRVNPLATPPPSSIRKAAAAAARDAKEVLLRLLLTLVVERSALPLLSAVFDSLNEGYLKAMVERAYSGGTSMYAGEHRTNNGHEGRAGGAATGSSQGSGGSTAGAGTASKSSPRFRLLSSFMGGGDPARSTADNTQGQDAPDDTDGIRDTASDAQQALGLEPPSHACSALLSLWVDEQQRLDEAGTKNKDDQQEQRALSEENAAGILAPVPPAKRLLKRFSSRLVFGRGADGEDGISSPARELSTQRNSRGHMIVLQSEMLAHVLLPAAADTSRVPRRYLIALLAEYLRSLQRNYIPAQQALHELLAELLAAEGRLGELYQLLQYRVSSDSPILAVRLLEIGAGLDLNANISTTAALRADISRHSCVQEAFEGSTTECTENALRSPALCQLALDMLFRQQEFTRLTCTLLAMARLLPAMRLARTRK